MSIFCVKMCSVMIIPIRGESTVKLTYVISGQKRRALTCQNSGTLRVRMLAMKRLQPSSRSYQHTYICK